MSCRAASSEEKTVLSWINALGLIFVSLPVSFLSFVTYMVTFIPLLMLQECYGMVLYEAVVETLNRRGKDDPSPFLEHVHRLVGKECQTSCLISLLHSYLMHSNIGLLLHLPQ